MIIGPQKAPVIIQEPVDNSKIKDPEQQESFAKRAALAAEASGANYQESLLKYQDMVARGMEGMVRDEISNLEFQQRQAAKVKNIAAAVQQGAEDVAAREIEAFAFEKATRDALERKYIDSLQNSMPPEWAEAASRVPDTYEARKKREKFRLYVDNQLTTLGVEEDNEGIFAETLDAAKAIIALPVFVDNFNFWEGTRADQINAVRKTLQFIKEQPEEQWNDLLNQLTREIRDSRFLLDNPQDAIDIYQVALGTEADLAEDTVFASLDGAFALAEINALKNIGKSKLLLKTGATKNVDEDVLAAKDLAGDQAVADDIVNGTKKYVKDAEEASEQINLFKAPSSAYKTGLSDKVRKKIELQEMELTETLKGFSSPEFNEQLLMKRKAQFEKEVIYRQVDGATINPETGTFEFRYSAADGRPFVTAERAQESIDKRGLQNAVVEETPHGYIVKVDTGSPDIDKGFNELNWFSRNLGNVSDTVKALLPIAQQAEGALNATQRTVKGMVEELSKFAGTKAGVNLEAVINSGRQNREWYTPVQFRDKYYALHKKNPTDAEEAAYATYRQLNDFSDMLRIKPQLEKSLAKDEKVYTIEGMDYTPIGTQVSETQVFTKLADEIDGDVVKNSNNTVVMDTSGIPQAYKKGKLKFKDEAEYTDFLNNYRLVQLNDLQKQDFIDLGITNDLVDVVAIPKTSKGRATTYDDFASYVAGGRTAVDAPAFVKVAMANGTNRLNDLTIAAASSAKQAKEFGKKYNELIKLMKANRDNLSALTDDAIEKLGLKTHGLTSVKAADEFMKEYKLYDYAIEAQGVGNRQIVQLERKDLDFGLSTDTMMASAYGQKLFGKRTGDLPHVDGGEANMLGPIEALVDSMNTATNFAGTAAFRERALAYMQGTFGKYLNTESSSPYALLTAPLKDKYNLPEYSRVAQAVRAHQQFLANMLSQPTQFENAWANWVDRAVNFAFDRKERFFGKGGYTRTDLQKRQNVIDMFGKDPITKARSLTFHSTLGLYSLPSFIMQLINVVNITALSPKFGAQAAGQSTYLRMALLANDKNVDDIVAKYYKQAGFKSADEVKSYIQEFKNLGMAEIGSNTVVIAGLNGAQLSGSVASKFLDNSRVFFDQGELLNRLTAYGAARKKWDNVVGKGRPADSPEGREFITSETHRLTLGMSRADLQLGLRNNLASIPTQFLSYPMRLVSAMTPEILGGSKSFTRAEKMRLIGMNLLMFGGAGVPLGDVVTDYLIQNHDMDAEQAKFLSNGLIDGALYAMSDGELDTNFSARAGTGEFMTQLVRDVGLAGDDAKSLIEILGGAAGSRGSSIATAADEFFTLMGAMSNPSIGDYAIATKDLLINSISSLKTYDKALTGYTQGLLMTRQGGKLGKITQKESIAIAFGLPPQVYENISVGIRNKKERQDIIKNEVALVRKMYQKYYNAESPQEKIEIAKSINLYFAGLQEAGLNIDVAQAFLRGEGFDDLESYIIRTEKEQKLRTPQGADKNYSEQITKE